MPETSLILMQLIQQEYNTDQIMLHEVNLIENNIIILHCELLLEMLN
nr:MAG TPA: hypothetical protein [Caudoviricetes sp.]